MNLARIDGEVTSEALQEVIHSTSEIVDRVREGSIMYKQGQAEIMGLKHILQAITLDWEYNRPARA